MSIWSAKQMDSSLGTTSARRWSAMAEIAIPDEYLFLFEKVFLALNYFLPYKPVYLLFLFACTSLFFYNNFQRRLQSCYTDLDCVGLDVLILLERNVSVLFIFLLCYSTDGIFSLIYFAAIFVPVNLAYIFHQKNRWMVVFCIDVIRKKMNQLVAIVSNEASPSDEQSTEEISAEPVVGDPKVASATNRHSKKKIIGESVDAKLEVGSSKDSALSKENTRERTNDRSNGASARRLRRKLKKKNIAEEAEASSEDPSPCNKEEDHHRSVEQKIENDPSNEDTKRTTSETGAVGFSTTGSDQLLIASSSKCLEEERLKWAEEREKLQTQLDSTTTILRHTYQSQQNIQAKYAEEKQNWEMEKRELTGKLQDSAITSKLLAFYKDKCLSLQLEKKGAASDQSWLKEKPVLTSETHRYTTWKLHCKAMEDYMIELDDRSAREKRELIGEIGEYGILVEQYRKSYNELGRQKLIADAALEMVNTAAADSRKRILELERRCRFCAVPNYGSDGELDYCPTHYNC